MDPLSITASTVTLIQAAGAVCSTLHQFAKTFRNADSRVEALCSQLSRLIKFLDTIDRTLRNCRGRLSLASMDEDLYHQSLLSLEDCKTTLDELARFINHTVTIAKSPGFFRRAKIATDLTMYAVEIAGFEEKVHKSNSALQTMLSAIQVALSLRGNETQDQIVFELKNLTTAIDQVMQASMEQNDRYSRIMQDPSEARVNHNLKGLAKAAKNFHSSASSTASTRESSSTVIGPSRPASWFGASEAAMSVVGGSNLTPNKRRLVNQFVKQQRHITQRRKRKPVPNVRRPAVLHSGVPSEINQDNDWDMSVVGDENENQDLDGENEVDDLESFLLSGHDDVAKDSMLNHEFAKAQSHLEKAIQSRTGSTSEDCKFKQLQIQLAICNFFQHQWQLAEPLIDSIAKSKANFDPVVCNLLHALAIANLLEGHFDKAVVLCKQALAGKRRLKAEFGATFDAECNNTLGLLARIHDHNEESVLAEAARRKMSRGFSYFHPENELEFLISHPTLCTEVVGKKMTMSWSRPAQPAGPPTSGTDGKTHLAPIQEVAEQISKSTRSGKKPLQTFHTKLDLYERMNVDSAKEVVGSLVPPEITPDDDFSMSLINLKYCSDSQQTIVPKRSRVRKIGRFLGIRRHSSSTSSECVEDKRRRMLPWLPGPPANTGSLCSASSGEASWAHLTPRTVCELPDTSTAIPWRAHPPAGFTQSQKATVITSRFGARWIPLLLERLAREDTEVAVARAEPSSHIPSRTMPHHPEQDTLSAETSLHSEPQKPSTVVELAFKGRSERAFESFKRHPIHGLLDSKDASSDLWAPASYILDSPQISTVQSDTGNGTSDHLPFQSCGSRESGSSVVSTEDRPSGRNVFFMSWEKTRNLMAKHESLFEAPQELPTARHQLYDNATAKPSKVVAVIDGAEGVIVDADQLEEEESPALQSHQTSPSTSSAPQPKQLRRKFSWEIGTGESSFSTERVTKNVELLMSLETSPHSLTRKFSWDSDEQPSTPDLVRSSSLSSSSNSSYSASSDTTAITATTATSVSSGSSLKYDPIEKDLVFVSDDPTSPSSETYSLTNFLKHLSASVEKKCDDFPAIELTFSSPLDLDFEARKSDKPEMPSPYCIDQYAFPAGGDGLSEYAVQLMPPGKMPFCVIDERGGNEMVSWFSDPAEGMLNRPHPLRKKRRGRKDKSAECNAKLIAEKSQYSAEGATSMATSGLGAVV